MNLLRKVCVLVPLLISTTVFADWNIQEEHWYGLTIDAIKSGWSTEIVEVNGDLFRSTNIQEFTISRGVTTITINVSTEFIETRDGDPISMKTIQTVLGATNETVMEFKKDHILLKAVAGGKPVIKELPLPTANWLTPLAVTRSFEKEVANNATDFTYQAISPDSGTTIVTFVLTKIGEEERVVLGKNTKVNLWKFENDTLPFVGVNSYTDAGLKVSSSLSTQFGEILTTLMSKQDAMSPLNEVPELMVSLFVEPDKSFSNGSDQKTLTLHIKSKDGTALTLPTSGAQRATTNDDGSVTLEINIDAPVAATPEEMNDPSYLSASAICDGTDEAVASIAYDALKKLPLGASELDKALALRAKVFDFIDDKNMSTAFASASQTARDRKGDCSEHGVLLCGVLRSAGIPSRAVLGMVYVPTYRGKPNGIFGWHMWSQALIDGTWIDLDATLRTSYNVGHINTTTTSLADESLALEMSTILTTIGNIEIEVVNASATSK